MRLGTSLLVASALLVGCPTDDGELAPITFDPAVNERGSGTIDLGDVEVGTNPPPSFTIIATNNTDEAVSIGVNCNTLAGTPFGSVSCPTDRVEVPEAGSTAPDGAANNTLAVGGNLLVGPNDVGEHSASILFDSDNVIYTFTLRVNVTN